MEETVARGERPYDNLAKCLEDAAGWSAWQYYNNAKYLSYILRQGSLYMSELLGKAHAAAERLCDCCGVCPKGRQDPFDCEIANLTPDDVPMEYLEAGGTL